MELINKFYLEDGHITDISNYAKDSIGDEIIYEVIRVLDGIPLFEDEHIYRMEKSFDLLNKQFPYEYNKIKEFIKRLIEANNIVNGNIKITYNLNYDSMKVYSIKHQYPSKDMYRDGVETILYYGERKNPNAKLIDKTLRADINNKIKEKNIFEAILVDKDGYITEGSKSNIFIIKNNTLITSKDEDVLKGITRNKIIKLSKNLKIRFEERQVNKEEIKKIDAIFISGTSPKILPIRKVNDINIDVNNEIMRLLMNHYDKLISKYIEENK